MTFFCWLIASESLIVNEIDGTAVCGYMSEIDVKVLYDWLCRITSCRSRAATVLGSWILMMNEDEKQTCRSLLMIVARWDRRDNNGTICKQRFYIFPADLSSLVQIVIQSSVERHAKVPCMLGYLRIYILWAYVHMYVNIMWIWIIYW